MCRRFLQTEDDYDGRKSLFIESKPAWFPAESWRLASATANAKLHSAPAIPKLTQSGRPLVRLEVLLDLLLIPDASPDITQIWKDYASHVALKLMQLYLTRQPIGHATCDVSAIRSSQFANLSMYLRPIVQSQPDFSAPLEQTLGNLAAALCGLFPPVLGKVRLHTAGLSFFLPGLYHRVVSAIGLELLLNVLQHGFFSGGSGDVHVVVGQQSPREGFLLVADNGRGVGCGSPGEGFRLINHLAGLINGETVLRRAGSNGTVVEARFCVPPRYLNE